MVGKDPQLWVDVRVSAGSSVAVLTPGKTQKCSLCVAWIAVVSMDEGCRGPQQLKLHISAGLVRAVGDLLIASFSPMDYFHGQGDLSLSLGIRSGSWMAF